MFEGQEITRVPAHQIVDYGIALAPEGRHCFARMTVRENLDLGAHLRRDLEINDDLERVFDLFPRLKERERQKAGTMSGGEQQMLAIGRALMARPKLLMLDEPSMGLAPLVVAEIFRLIRRLRDEMGIGILLVEQNAKAALRIADLGCVLSLGNVTMQGTGADLLHDPDVVEAFLGGHKAA